MTRSISRLLLVAFVAFGIAGCRTSIIYDVNSAPLNAPAKATMEDINLTIKRAAAALGWKLTDVRPGVMIGQLQLRDHTAIVDITHDTKAFSIKYKDSVNLDYNGRSIHQNYNGWIQNLEKAILRQASLI